MDQLFSKSTVKDGLENFEANLSKLENFCYDEKNFKLPVMQAIEKVIGTGK